MVGGTVVEVCELPDRVGCLFVDVVDPAYPKQHCGIVVQQTLAAECIDIGDQIWWQSGTAYWTPQATYQLSSLATHKETDIPIPKIGHSGVPHPLRAC